MYRVDEKMVSISLTNSAKLHPQGGFAVWVVNKKRFEDHRIWADVITTKVVSAYGNL